MNCKRAKEKWRKTEKGAITRHDLRGRDKYDLHFTGGVVHRGYVTCPKSPSKEGAELGLKPIQMGV